MAKEKYEGMFLFPGAAEAEASIKRVRDILEKQGCSVLVIKKWDERKLAYEVKKQKRGLFVLAYFTGPGQAITALTRDVNLSDDILRVLVTDGSHLTTEEMEKAEPQPIVVKEPFDRAAGGFGGGWGGDRDGGGRDGGRDGGGRDGGRDGGGRDGGRPPRRRDDEPATV